MVGTSIACAASSGETLPVTTSEMAPSSAMPVRSSASRGSRLRTMPRHTTRKKTGVTHSTAISLRRTSQRCKVADRRS